MSVKKIVNNSSFIANMAGKLNNQYGDELAEVAQLYRSIVKDMGIKADLTDFKGCEQGQLLWEWVYGGKEPDAALMTEWTECIKAAIKDLADGKLPTEE